MEEQIIKTVFSQKHKLEVLLDNGTVSKELLQSWLIQRYQFELTMVKKDLIILEKCPDRQFRQGWIQRVIDADSVGGGLDGWVKLGNAAGVDVTDVSKVLPGVKFALNLFLDWCINNDWKTVVSGSLSQLNAVNNHRNKFDTWATLYPWIEPEGLEYFIVRFVQVGNDSKKCLEFIKNAGLSEEVLTESANVKRNLMKSLLDAIY